MACDVPEPCEFLYLDWHHKEADLVLQPVAGLVVRVGEAETFPHSLAFQSLDLFCQGQPARPAHVSQPYRRMEVTKDLYNFGTDCEAGGVALPDPVYFAIAVLAETILTRTSSQKVPSLHSVAPRYLKLVTSSNFRPFTLISALMLFTLLVVTLLFSVLTSISYAVAVYESVGDVLKFTVAAPVRLVGCIRVCARWRWRCGGSGVFLAWVFSRNMLNRMNKSNHP